MSHHTANTIERPALSPAALAARTSPSYCTRPAHSSALDLAGRLICEPDCSGWLRGAIIGALGRDAVDSVADAELLLSVLSARLEELQADPRTPDRSAWQAEQSAFYSEKFASKGGAK
jgi:hypothetical protein